MVQARQLSREAMEMMEEAEKKCATAEDNVIAVRERATTCVRVERAIQAKQEANHEEKVKAILQKRDQEYEAAIAHDKKFSLIKKELDNTSKKLSEQHEIWSCSPYLLYGDGEPYMKISMFLKSRVRPLPVLPKDPNGLSMQKQCLCNVL